MNRVHSLLYVFARRIACIVTTSSPHVGFMVAGYYIDLFFFVCNFRSCATKAHHRLAPSLDVEVLGSAVSMAQKALSIHGNLLQLHSTTITTLHSFSVY